MRTIIILLSIISFNSYSQDFNAYKYVVINQNQDPLDIGSAVGQELKSYGVNALTSRGQMPADFINCQALYCQLTYTPSETISQIVQLKFTDCDGNVIFESQSGCAVCGVTVAAELKKASIKAVRKLNLRSYKYDPEILEYKFPDVEMTNETGISLTDYYDSNNLDDIEGIYKSQSVNGNSYRIGIKKFEKLFKAIIIESDYPHWKIGEVKAVFEPTATPGAYSCEYYLANKTKVEYFVIMENSAILTINDADFIKMYPSVKGVSSNKSGEEWKGNGSGLILSKSGYIVTNYHVIENANDIEIEIIIDQAISKLNAELVQSDKINDLAIIKVVDMNFDGFDNLNYNFKTTSSDVGTKVYAYGYPMALSVMGKEIKVTDGMINSKTGYDGDITTYQISAPIQGGNSGGPLFDDNGNLLGINSSGLNKTVADNVGYSIKTSYIANLIDVLPRPIELPSSTKLQGMTLTEQIKEISKLVVLIKVK